ncbi:MAG: helix-turn-helix transcriptional regulator [Firmicutes bacterium]|nr:helix-turn-helix transcriptional regulator [Bacillota bacterium]
MAKIQYQEANCPVIVVQNLLAGKWKLVILWHLIEKTRRFNELQKLLPEISQGILTQQLRELERDGLVHREVYKEVPPKVEYSLTDIGQSLKPVMDVVAKWGETYLKKKRLHRP